MDLRVNTYILISFNMLINSYFDKNFDMELESFLVIGKLKECNARGNKRISFNEHTLGNILFMKNPSCQDSESHSSALSKSSTNIYILRY